MPLEWEDVRRVLAAIDASPGRELELEIGELRLVVGRGPAPLTPDAADDFELRSPAVGLFRRAAVPDGLAMVAPGALARADDVLAAVEVVDELEPVRAPRTVEVVRVLVDDGDFVEYGQPLMRLRPR